MNKQRYRLVRIQHNWKRHVIESAVEALQSQGILVWTWYDNADDFVLEVQDKDATAAWAAVDKAAEEYQAHNK